MACFNTSLVTPRQEQIFAVFNGLQTPTLLGHKWSLVGFFKESDGRLTNFAERPDIANYFTDPAELLYDPRVELFPDIDHIIGDNIERFPEALRQNEYALRGVLEGQINGAKRRVRRNYKTAIPQFYRGKIQSLLPLCLLSPERADLALVVSKENRVYTAETVLPLDWAYDNARLISRTDTEWLDP